MIVYLLTSPSGKHYVGITSKTLKKRWQTHCRKTLSGSQLALHEAIRFHGPESFKVETIEEVGTWEEACEREKFWIAWIGTRPPFGYNLTDGGEGRFGSKQSQETKSKIGNSCRGRKMPPRSREHCIKISEAKKGRPIGPFSPETRAKMSASLRGNKRNLGRKHSEETRAKISAANRRHVGCCVEGCEGSHDARGFCYRHYHVWRKSK